VTGRPRDVPGDSDNLGLWKLDPAGVLQGGFPIVRDGDGDGAGHHWHDVGADVEVDADDQIWVAGWTSDPVGNQQAALWRFDQQGALASGFPWILAAPDVQYSEARALALDPGGDVWVGGRLSSGSYVTDAAFWRLGRDGALRPGSPLLWDGQADHTEEVRGLALDAAGALWASGTSVNPAGNLDVALWRVAEGALAAGYPQLRDDVAGGHFDDLAGTLAIDRGRWLWVAGSSYNAAMNQDLVVWKLE
jgi:hypothetical protein